MNRIKRMILKVAMLSVTLTLFFATNAPAASFDCAKARSVVENMICADADLARLDEVLADAYKTVLQKGKNASVIRQAQKDWLKKRNGCADASCVKQAYEVRLQELVPSSGGTYTPPMDEEGNSVLQGLIPALKPLYGHCVDVQDPRNCGRFQSGKGYTVCEKYLEHLNSLTKIPKCEVPVPPSFQRPDWEEVNVMQHLEWAYQAETIRFGKSSWYTHPTFLIWRKEFLAEKEAGRIAPAMRKVRVKPLGKGKEITILAYTRHREGCQESARKLSDKATRWSDVGYAHLLLPEALGTSPVERLERNGPATDQTEMLLYAGRPYFVRIFGPPIYDTPGIMIYAIAPRHMPIANEPEYLFKDFCIFEPFSRNPTK